MVVVLERNSWNASVVETQGAGRRVLVNVCRFISIAKQTFRLRMRFGKRAEAV